MTTSVVARTIGIDFIYFDIIFITIWVFFLIKKKYWTPILWGLVGWIIYIFVDYVYWYLITQTRHYIGSINPFLFFVWFCFSPGFVQFSYVIVMFEKRNRKELLFWTLLLYIGWTLVAVGSQIIPLNDAIIKVYRDMNVDNQRLNELILVLINIVVATILYFKKKLRLEDILYLFLVGTLVEFALEFTLSVSGIRQEQGGWSFLTMIINTLLEFNLGIILMYLLWVPFKIRKHGKYYFQLSFRDLKAIKTDFDAIASLSETKQIHDKRMREYSKLYRLEDFLSDLNYYSKAYSSTPIGSDLGVKLKEYWERN
ncbi:MAG: hypothetical protein EAX91_04510 [Candidatus Lokiarchaeota archaeon]|nr:hypothetical protein [Candidatus Lokiarchaeota archaeon]